MADTVGNDQARIDLPSKQAITKVIAEHPLVGFNGVVKRAFLVGSFARSTPHAASDVDILLEVSARRGYTAEDLEEKYRQKLRQHFVTHNIKGQADHLHHSGMAGAWTSTSRTTQMPRRDPRLSCVEEPVRISRAP